MRLSALPGPLRTADEEERTRANLLGSIIYNPRLMTEPEPAFGARVPVVSPAEAGEWVSGTLHGSRVRLAECLRAEGRGRLYLVRPGGYPVSGLKRERVRDRPCSLGAGLATKSSRQPKFQAEARAGDACRRACQGRYPP